MLGKGLGQLIASIDTFVLNGVALTVQLEALAFTEVVLQCDDFAALVVVGLNPAAIGGRDLSHSASAIVVGHGVVLVSGGGLAHGFAEQPALCVVAELDLQTVGVFHQGRQALGIMGKDLVGLPQGIGGSNAIALQVVLEFTAVVNVGTWAVEGGELALGVVGVGECAAVAVHTDPSTQGIKGDRVCVICGVCVICCVGVAGGFFD